MRKAIALSALVLASIALVACGGDDNGTTTAGGGATATTEGGGAAQTAPAAGGAQKGGGAASTTLKLEADPGGQIKYTTDTLTAKAGTVTIDLDNPQALEHDVAVEDSSGKQLGKSDTVTQGSTSVTIQNLKPGKYTYYCTVPGHRQAGMVGTLTVK